MKSGHNKCQPLHIQSEQHGKVNNIKCEATLNTIDSHCSGIPFTKNIPAGKITSIQIQVQTSNFEYWCYLLEGTCSSYVTPTLPWTLMSDFQLPDPSFAWVKNDHDQSFMFDILVGLTS